MLPSAYGLRQYFQDLGHSFSPYGPPSRQITYISFPNICIISPLKAYFDYISKPFVTRNKIFIIGPFYCPCSVVNIFWKL